MKNFLLPYYCKTIGAILVLIGLAFSVLYLQFDFNYTSSVFAIISIYLENRFFIITKTNIIDEVTMILFVVGFALLAFSEEKNEKESLNVLREKALTKATLANIYFMLFSILFIYGGGFIGILVFNMISVFIFYLIFFRLSVRKGNKQRAK